MNRRSTVVLVMLCVLGCGLCIPAIKQNQDAARRTECQANLKQIGMGFHGYAGTYHGRMPGVHARMVWPQQPSEVEFAKQVSWLYEISAYVESRMDPKVFLDPTKPMDAEENQYAVNISFPVYLCPENHGPENNYTNYVGITGVGRDAAVLPLSDPRCGFFGEAPRFIGTSIKDGTSNTLAVIETAIDNGPWALSGPHTVRGLDIEGADYLGEHGQFNSFHFRGSLFRGDPITHACVADGSVRGLSANLSPAVFEALATIAGGEQLPPDW